VARRRGNAGKRVSVLWLVVRFLVGLEQGKKNTFRRVFLFAFATKKSENKGRLLLAPGGQAFVAHDTRTRQRPPSEPQLEIQNARPKRFIALRRSCAFCAARS